MSAVTDTDLSGSMPTYQSGLKQLTNYDGVCLTPGYAWFVN